MRRHAGVDVGDRLERGVERVAGSHDLRRNAGSVSPPTHTGMCPFTGFGSNPISGTS